LIECFQDAGLVAVAAAAFQECICFITTVAAKVAVQQIDHRPQMTSFFDVHLKEIAHVVQRRAGMTEKSLLFD